MESGAWRVETLACKSAWTLHESRSGSWMLGLAPSQFESSAGLNLRVSSSPYGGPFGRDLWRELCRAPLQVPIGGPYGRALLEGTIVAPIDPHCWTLLEDPIGGPNWRALPGVPIVSVSYTHLTLPTILRV